MSHTTPFIYDFIAGYFGGVCGVIVGHPFDTVKIRLQTRGHLYRSGLDAFRVIMRTEGPRALFKGVLAPCVGVGAINAIIFGVEGEGMRYLVDETPANHMIAGTIAGGVQCVVTGPMELVKTQMQVTGIGDASVKPSLSKTAREIYRNDGLKGFGRGLGTTLCRELPAFACYFGSYDALLKITNYHPTDDHATVKVLVSGGLAGVNSWVLTYPVDQIKSKLQADQTNRFSGPADCIQKTMTEEGFRGFYRGISTAVVRAFVVNAATFGGVNYMMNILLQQSSS